MRNELNKMCFAMLCFFDFARSEARPPASIVVLHKTCKNLAKGGTRASSTPRHLPIERKQVIAEEILGADKETSPTDRVASITQISELVKYSKGKLVSTENCGQVKLRKSKFIGMQNCGKTKLMTYYHIQSCGYA